jgi:hypothetical protein
MMQLTLCVGLSSVKLASKLGSSLLASGAEVGAGSRQARASEPAGALPSSVYTCHLPP